MKDYEAHIINEKVSNINKYKTSYCREMINLDFYFISTDHALNSLEAETRMRPCPECKKKIIELLNTK